MPTNDPEKQRRYRRDWYERNKERQAKYKRDRQAALTEWLREYKKTLRCSRCPESDYVCLEFHHRDRSQKVLSIHRAVKNGWSINRLLSEIAKCDVLCLNCHRKEHRDAAHLRDYW